MFITVSLFHIFLTLNWISFNYASKMPFVSLPSVFFWCSRNDILLLHFCTYINKSNGKQDPYDFLIVYGLFSLSLFLQKAVWASGCSAQCHYHNSRTYLQCLFVQIMICWFSTDTHSSLIIMAKISNNNIFRLCTFFHTARIHILFLLVWFLW